MDFKIITPDGAAITAPDMHGKVINGFIPFSVRGPKFIELKDGTIVYFFKARCDSQLDEALTYQVLMRSKDGGRTWGEMRILSYDDCPFNIACAPVYDEVHDMLIMLGRTRHWKAGFEEERLINEHDQLAGRVYERFWVSKSNDGGLSWSDYKEVTINYTPRNWTIQHCPTPGIGIQLKYQKDFTKNGRLVMPYNHALLDDGINKWGAHIIISDDFGDTWRVGALQEYSGANESMIAERCDGTIILNSRNQGGVPENLRIQGFSIDGGETLVNNGVIDTLYDPICHAGFTSAVINGREYIFFTTPSGELEEPVTWFGKQERWGKREALMLYASTDGGKTYKVIKYVSEKNVFAAYSAIFPTKEGKLLCAWESGPEIGLYRDIRYKIFELKELAKLNEICSLKQS